MNLDATLLVKYSAVAVAIQVVLAAAVVLGTGGSLLEAVIDFYYPIIFAVTKLGGFSGESTMMWPVFLGVPLGILLYGIAFGILWGFIKKR